MDIKDILMSPQLAYAMLQGAGGIAATDPSSPQYNVANNMSSILSNKMAADARKKREEEEEKKKPRFGLNTPFGELGVTKGGDFYGRDVGIPGLATASFGGGQGFSGGVNLGNMMNYNSGSSVVPKAGAAPTPMGQIGQSRFPSMGESPTGVGREQMPSLPKLNLDGWQKNASFGQRAKAMYNRLSSYGRGQEDENGRPFNLTFGGGEQGDNPVPRMGSSWDYIAMSPEQQAAMRGEFLQEARFKEDKRARRVEEGLMQSAEGRAQSAEGRAQEMHGVAMGDVPYNRASQVAQIYQGLAGADANTALAEQRRTETENFLPAREQIELEGQQRISEIGARATADQALERIRLSNEQSLQNARIQAQKDIVEAEGKIRMDIAKYVSPQEQAVLDKQLAVAEQQLIAAQNAAGGKLTVADQSELAFKGMEDAKKAIWDSMQYALAYQRITPEAVQQLADQAAGAALIKWKLSGLLPDIPIDMEIAGKIFNVGGTPDPDSVAGSPAGTMKEIPGRGVYIKGEDGQWRPLSR